MSDPIPTENFIGRRRLLGLIGTAAGALAVVGCGGGGESGSSDDSAAAASSSSSSSSGSSSSSSSSGAATESCSVTPEGEIGPYFADDSASGFNRSNILSNIDGSDVQAGIPLTLHIYVYDAEKSCAPVEGSQVDIWHCNADGVYSDIASEGTSADSYLRGYQITDATGLVTFQTIIPGWYQGRTTHIHLRVRSSYSEASSTSDGSNTTQLFFPQALVDTLDTTISPYSGEGKNPTTNAGDHVYNGETDGQIMLSPTGDSSSGYTATCSVYLPITAI